jgi:DNA-binding NarL/FixJ family response regulator
VKIRALLVDDNAEFLDTAARFLATHSPLRVVGRAATGASAIEQAAFLKPDLVLLDLAMPGIGGMETLARLKRLEDPPRVVIVTLHDGLAYRTAAFRAGADAFVSKDQFAGAIAPLIEELFAQRAPKPSDAGPR